MSIYALLLRHCSMLSVPLRERTLSTAVYRGKISSERLCAEEHEYAAMVISASPSKLILTACRLSEHTSRSHSPSALREEDSDRVVIRVSTGKDVVSQMRMRL